MHFRDIEVDGAGTDVFDARSAGGATFQNVDARNIGWWGVNNCSLSSQVQPCSIRTGLPCLVSV